MYRMSLTVAMGAVAAASTLAATLKPIDSDLKPADGKTIAVYKTTPQGELKVHLYFPQGWSPADHRPGIIFFFGGGFVNGSPKQFFTTAEYLASRGMVAASAEYRIGNTHHTPPEKSIEDAKSAVRWLRINARRLGIDPGRVIAGGGSAGATCAAFAAYNTTFEPEGEDKSVSSVPDALVLYNPALGFPADTSSYDARQMEQVKRLGAFISSWKVVKGGPPAILFYGTEDELAERGRAFAEQLIAASTRAEFYSAPGQKHGFFNDRGNSPWHALVVRQTDLFLSSLGYLQGQPAKAIPAGTTESLQKVLP